MKAGGAANSPSYKIFVRKFDDGDPEQFILMMQDFNTIWKQNSLATAEDKLANIRAVLRNDSLTQFEASLEEQRHPEPKEDESEDEVQLELSNDMIKIALQEVAKAVFPHRALDMQKVWMRRIMRKPKDMPFRTLNTCVNKMNNAFQHFPGATPESPLSELDILEMLEWCIPQTWRSKFDLDGYIPTMHPRATLLSHCAAIERYEATGPPAATTHTKKLNTNTKKKSKGRSGVTAVSFHCSHHGANATHDTKDCFILKNKSSGMPYAGKGAGKTPKHTKTFSKKSFRKELHSLSRTTDKSKVLDQFASIIREEKSKLLGKAQRVLAKADDPESSTSESDEESVHFLEVVPAPIKGSKEVPKEEWKFIPAGELPTGPKLTSPGAIKKQELLNMKRTLECLREARAKAKANTPKDSTPMDVDAPEEAVTKKKLVKKRVAKLGKSPDDKSSDTETKTTA
jgi:hypothetical protein